MRYTNKVGIIIVIKAALIKKIVRITLAFEGGKIIFPRARKLLFNVKGCN